MITQQLDYFYDNLLTISQYPLVKKYCTYQDFKTRQHRYDLIKGDIIDFNRDFYNISENYKQFYQYLDDMRQLQVIDHMIFYKNGIVYYQGFYFKITKSDELIHIPNITYDLAYRLQSILQLRRLFPSSLIEVQTSLVNELSIINCFYRDVLYIKWCLKSIGPIVGFNYQLQFNNQIEYGEFFINNGQCGLKNILLRYMKNARLAILIIIKASLYDSILFDICCSVFRNRCFFINCLGRDIYQEKSSKIEDLLFCLVDNKHVVNAMIIKDTNQILMKVLKSTIIGDLLFIKDTFLIIQDVYVLFIDIDERVVYAVLSFDCLRYEHMKMTFKWNFMIIDNDYRFYNDFLECQDKNSSMMLKVKGFIYRFNKYKLRKHVKRYIIQL